MTPNSHAQVECADRFRDYYWQSFKGWTTLVALVLIGGLAVSGLHGDWGWIGVAVIVLISTILIVPRVIKIHRFLQVQPCPHCRKAVGAYESRSSRIVLCCQHCKMKSTTDCLIPYAGGPPSKG